MQSFGVLNYAFARLEEDMVTVCTKERGGMSAMLASFAGVGVALTGGTAAAAGKTEKAVDRKNLILLDLEPSSWRLGSSSTLPDAG